MVAFSCCSSASPRLEDYSKAYQDCLLNAGQLNNSVIHACAGNISRRVGLEITERLHLLRDIYSSEALQDVDKLNESQEAWLSYRDAQCDLSGIHIGSPMYSLCPMEKGIQRLNEINDLLQQ